MWPRHYGVGSTRKGLVNPVKTCTNMQTDREASADSGSLAKVRRAQSVLSRLVTNEVLTPAGKDFLTAALDPMHDLPLSNLKGWPDIESTASIVRCVKQTQTVKTPYGAGSGNWDCLISLWPFLNSVSCNLYSHTNNCIGTGGGVLTFDLGGLQMWTNASGSPMFLNTGSLAQITLPASYTQGSGRIVGIGFEVVNTTAEIYKQGQVTVFRQPQPSLISQYVAVTQVGGAASTGSGASCYSIRAPPTDQPTAMLLAGSRQWLAGDGCYVVGAFAGSDNPPVPVNYNQPFIIADEVASTPDNASSTSTVMFPQFAFSGPGGIVKSFPTQKLYPLHTGGAYFTGLSEQSTLSVTLNVYVETFPSPTEDIVTLATPSAEFDARALEIFSHALNTMPVGVPADMNGFGDWFAGVISQVSKWIAPTLAASGNPLGVGIGALASGAGALADNYLAAQTPKSKPKPQAKQPANRNAQRKKNNKAQQNNKNAKKKG